MLKERIVIGISFAILGSTQGESGNICNRLNHTTVLGEIFLEFLLACIGFVEQSLADNLIDFFGSNRDTGLESGFYLVEQMQVQPSRIEHIIESLLGDTHRPDTVAQG